MKGLLCFFAGSGRFPEKMRKAISNRELVCKLICENNNEDCENLSYRL